MKASRQNQNARGWRMLLPALLAAVLLVQLCGCGADSGSSGAGGASSGAAEGSSDTWEAGERIIPLPEQSADASNAEYGTATPAPTAPSDTGILQTPRPYSYADDHDTAPMPETPLTVDMLLGAWSPDINAAEPDIIEFFYDENNELVYDYYSILNQPLTYGPGPTKFELNSGKVHLMLNQGSCDCFVIHSEKIYISFYLHDMPDGVITNQVSGKQFYKVDDWTGM